ncbi:hypothetical protein JT358_04390 [Micrococcales bacterium 31B]|nr:hypothetical protein [Micrococcales bacterium 31B]
MAIFDRVVGALVYATKPLFKDSPPNRGATPNRSPEASTPPAPPRPAEPERETVDLPEGKVTPWFGGYRFENVGSATRRDLLPEAFIVISSLDELDGHAPFVAPYLTAHLTGLESGATWRYGTDDAFVRLDFAPGEVTLTRAASGSAPSTYGPFEVPASLIESGEALVTLAADSIATWQVAGANLNDATPLFTHGNENGIDRSYDLDLADAEWLASARVSVSGVAGLRMGYTGYVGLRDPQWVTGPDGEIVQREGRSYLSLTCAGPGHFPTAHWGIFSVDASSVDGLLAPRLEALHYFCRDGRVLGDHLGQVVIDDDAQHLILSNRCSFGLNPQHLQYAPVEAAADDLDATLSGVHVHSPVAYSAPTLFDNWGPNLRRIEDRWHLAFVECLGYEPRFSFRPVLAIGEPGGSIRGPFSRVGTDPVHQQTEGVLVSRIGDQNVVVASDGDARDFPVYDLSMRRIAQVDAPFGSNIPHFAAVEVEGQPLRALSFDGSSEHESVIGYGGHGDLLVYENRA